MKERYEKLLNDIKSQEETDTLLKNQEKIKREKWSLNWQLDSHNKILKEFKLELKKLETFNNKLFHRKDYKSKKEKIKSDIDSLVRDIEKTKESINKLQNEQKKMEKKLKSLNVTIDEDPYGKNKKRIPFSMSEEGFIYINTENLETLPEKATSIDIDEKVLVHCTNFFPISNKILTSSEGRKIDGKSDGKVDITYKGFTKTIPSISTRNTVHFTENNVVGNHIYGTFPDHYIILEPIKHHMDQIVNENPSDTWTRGSVTLSNDAIILVKKDKINNIPKDVIKKYNIILYDGDRKICVKNLLEQLGYPILETCVSYPAHAASLDCHLEVCIKIRNQMISFFQGKVINSNNFSLDMKNMMILYDFFKTAYCFYNFGEQFNDKFLNSQVTKQLCKKYNIDFELFKFFINFGMLKNGENYVPISYDKMVELSDIINDKNFNENAFSMIISKFGISELQEALNNKKEEDMIIVDKNELLDKSFNEINNFENLRFAAEFQNYVKKIFESLGLESTVSFDMEGINVMFYSTKDKSEVYFKDGFDITTISEFGYGEEIHRRLSFHLNCKDLSCAEILEQCNKYVQSVGKLNNKKCSKKW